MRYWCSSRLSVLGRQGSYVSDRFRLGVNIHFVFSSICMRVQVVMDIIYKVVEVEAGGSYFRGQGFK